ncbi:MAG: hypothetical protein CR972_00145 [Candidatus Moraniibacteriota bacterium]|nr:MAG: hypothetical protein CR972_00145 [Candidatus Moranbacteria bacterium]
MKKIQWEDIIFFKGLDNPNLANELMTKLKEYAGVHPLVGHINYHRFTDGELDDVFADYENIEGKTVVFFECLKDEQTMLRFLQLCWAMKKQYKVKYIVAVISFFHYRRQDRPEKKQEIHRNLWLAEMLKVNGVDYVIVATPHSDRMQKNCENVNLQFRSVDSSEAFASVLRPVIPENGDSERAVVYSPDEGSVSRAVTLAIFLGIGVLFNLKDRPPNNETTMALADEKKIAEIIERVEKEYGFSDIQYATENLIRGVHIIMAEDELDTGGTLNKQGVMLNESGAVAVHAVITHPVCSDGWKRKVFYKDPFAKIIMMDTIFRSAEQRTGGRVHDVSVAGLLASTIFRVLQKVM